jgi:hypothetical protein
MVEVLTRSSQLCEIGTSTNVVGVQDKDLERRNNYWSY